MKIRIVIPARFNSSRLPKKLIKKINSKTLIEHVLLRAKKIKSDTLIIATDSKIIEQIAKSSFIDCWYSKKKFLNGTDRISFLSKKLNYKKDDIVINIQADEFNFPLSGISKMINYMKKFPSIRVATLITRNKKRAMYEDKNVVKVLVDKDNYGLTFSRSLIPYKSPTNSLIHIGIYGYRVDALNMYPNLSICPYEKYEKLEQLRFLWNNIKIKCILAEKNKSISINSLKDLKVARKFRV